jgi:uncharacterized protein YebE (UPF0316 family)
MDHSSASYHSCPYCRSNHWHFTVDFSFQGFRILTPLLGFFEVIIWLLAVSQIFQHLDNWLAYVAYGLGFAIGNYIGIVLEQKISLGNVIVRIVPKYDTTELINYLKESNFGITSVNAEGSRGPVKVIFSIIKRRDIKQFVSSLSASIQMHFIPSKMCALFMKV